MVEWSVKEYFLILKTMIILCLEVDLKKQKARRSTKGGKVKDENTQISYSRVISNYRLSDWMKKYCIHSSFFN
jgi:hypothetical protein